MAGLDDVTQGFIDAWNEFVDGTKTPDSYKTDKVSSTDKADVRAKQMGRRLAAEKWKTMYGSGP